MHLGIFNLFLKIDIFLFFYAVYIILYTYFSFVFILFLKCYLSDSDTLEGARFCGQAW